MTLGCTNTSTNTNITHTYKHNIQIETQHTKKLVEKEEEEVEYRERVSLGCKLERKLHKVHQPASLHCVRLQDHTNTNTQIHKYKYTNTRIQTGKQVAQGAPANQPASLSVRGGIARSHKCKYKLTQIHSQITMVIQTKVPQIHTAEAFINYSEDALPDHSNTNTSPLQSRECLREPT